MAREEKVVLRAVILAATITAIIMGLLDRPKPVAAVKVDYCMQPIWNVWGDVIGGKWVICSELDRYEDA